MSLDHEIDDAAIEAHGQYVRALMRDLGSDVEPAGLELARLVRMVANQYEAIAAERLRSAELSGPRLGLLMRLMAEETYGGEREGISPTHLSRCQHVSKNTISALLRSLEEQGLIERTLHPGDRRAFRIRVSPAGRELVRATAPRHMAYLNDLVADLSPEQRAQLAALLAKLHESLVTRSTAIEGALEATERSRILSAQGPDRSD